MEVVLNVFNLEVQAQAAQNLKITSIAKENWFCFVPSSSTGKEVTIALVDAGEFLGEDCMVSAHPLRVSTATAITESSLLRISKAEMVRVLHQEPTLSDMFVSFLLVRNRSYAG